VEPGSLVMTGNPIGALLSIGIVGSVFPVAGLFVVAAIGLGAIYGAAL
jgi:hypothetical protein